MLNVTSDVDSPLGGAISANMLEGHLHQSRNPVYNTLNSFFFVWCFKHKACFYICALHERSDLTENIQNQSHNEKGKPQEINQSQLSETYSIVTYEYNAGELLFFS